MAEIQVTPEALRSSSQLFSLCAAQFSSLMNEIKQDMAQMKNQWEGQAAEQFFQRFSALDKNFAAYNKVIVEYSQFLGRAADDYQHIDDMARANTGALAGSGNLFA